MEAVAPLRIIGYTRLSRASREESTSIERQRLVIESTCVARGWEHIETIDDIDVSATRTRLDRPGLNKARQMIQEGKADAILVWRLDRIARSVVDMGTLLDEGLSIISATEPFDTATPMGRAMVEVLQVFARLEAANIGIRVSASQAHLRSIGRFPGGVVPYGYKSVPHPDGVGRALEVNPEEAEVVEKMVRLALMGKTMYHIARTLNEEGVKPRRAQQWSTTSIQRILRSDAILGRMRMNGKVIRDDEGLPVTHWEPLITVEQSNTLRGITEWTPMGRREYQRQPSRSLNGFLRCFSCNSRLRIQRRSTDEPDTIKVQYVCDSRRQGHLCAQGVGIDAPTIESYVSDLFLQKFGHHELVKETRTVANSVERAELEEAINDVTRLLGEDDADINVLMERLQALKARRASLGDAVEKVVVEKTGVTLAEAWDGKSIETQQRLYRMSGLSVIVLPGQRGNFLIERRVEIRIENKHFLDQAEN